MEGWKEYKINDLILKSYQRDPRKKPEEYFKYVDVSSVSRENYSIADYTITKGENAPSRARKIIQKNDMIFATVRPTLMRIALVPEEFHNEICSTGYCVLKPNTDLITPAFLYYSVLPDYFISKIGKLQRGASYPAIRDADLKNQKIIVPPLPEQRKIAHILSTIQKAIEQQDKLIKTTTELKKALMQKLFTEGLPEFRRRAGLYGEKQKKTEIGPVPESWEVVPLKDIIIQSKGGGTPSTKKAEYWGGDIYWTTSKWLSEEKIFLNDGEKKITKVGLENSSSNLLPANNLLISTRVVIGKVAINKIPIAFSQDLTGLWIDDNLFDLRFLAYQFLSKRVNNHLQTLKRGATIQGITREDLLNTRFVVPSYIEQKEIGDIIQVFNHKIEYHQTKKQTLTDLFKTLLHELMTGQRRVNKIDFENEKEELLMAAEPEIKYKSKTFK